MFEAFHAVLTGIAVPSPFPLLGFPLSPLHSSLTTSGSSVALILPPERSVAAIASSTRSSPDTLPSIPASAALQIPRAPSLRGSWSQSYLNTRQRVTGALNASVSRNTDLRKKSRVPNAPLVFCHGFMGFDSISIGPVVASLQLSHWGGIKEALEANGCQVLITHVPATSSPIDRAKILEMTISEAYPGGDVHLIGHSMGGIDCRYLITHLTRRTFRVLSLTTISTPHHGSSFASHFLSLASARLPAVLALLQLLPNGNGDGKAVECLTREAMSEFNDNTPNVDDVRYFSWGAEYQPGVIDPWKYPHSVIAAQEGANDGMVSVQSAQWGTYLGTLHNVKHIDLAGWTGRLTGNLTSLVGLGGMHVFTHRKNAGFSAEGFYSSIADLLAGVEEEGRYVIDGSRKRTIT